MKKEILIAIENVEIYPVISLLIFVLFFIGMAWWVLKADRNYVDHMKSLPVHDGNPKNDNTYEKE
ncbi:cbb3-type cytochrome c oxidase subunit 3 [Echinicola jeungdonensis]|uniref:Cbb3-type cytochrome c oxidase subunit 3 n=1 Tax=Echinicola jeungdonensis TaxID=709343 RepID=A0ABV5J0J3_9BACT|nr:cbb3-type cytochrome c oxidase subunit 3 [Echinicola jeungdonensis]MDN3667788.1 cbb3-type cytochrome c oxidase subunit 3 [Echinicola jeungdonensis]